MLLNVLGVAMVDVIGAFRGRSDHCRRTWYILMVRQKVRMIARTIWGMPRADHAGTVLRFSDRLSGVVPVVMVVCRSSDQRYRRTRRNPRTYAPAPQIPHCTSGGKTTVQASAQGCSILVLSGHSRLFLSNSSNVSPLHGHDAESVVPSSTIGPTPHFPSKFGCSRRRW